MLTLVLRSLPTTLKEGRAAHALGTSSLSVVGFHHLPMVRAGYLSRDDNVGNVPAVIKCPGCELSLRGVENINRSVKWLSSTETGV